MTGDKLSLDPSEITLDSRFTDDLNADSLDTVELVMAFEDEFGLDIPDADAESFIRVRDVVRYIKNRLKRKRA